jgi:hypothetical protein
MMTFEKSESIINLAQALAHFHSLAPKIAKSSQGYGYKYASLSTIDEAIKSPLLESGLVLSQFPSGDNCLVSILMHTESGEWMQCEYHMQPTKNDPQGFGSVITYMRRYAKGAILSLDIDEDTDASEHQVEKVVNAPKRNVQEPDFI